MLIYKLELGPLNMKLFENLRVRYEINFLLLVISVAFLWRGRVWEGNALPSQLCLLPTPSVVFITYPPLQLCSLPPVFCLLS